MSIPFKTAVIVANTFVKVELGFTTLPGHVVQNGLEDVAIDKMDFTGCC